MKIILYFLGLLILSACGIKGLPLSPSEVKSNKDESLFPFNQEPPKDKTNGEGKKPYASISELEQIGYDYNANFGLENDNLEDSFERIKPKSALVKKRPIIPLGQSY